MVTPATTTTAAYDPSEFLDDAESQAELLNEALQSGNAGFVADAIGIIARARGMSELSRLTGMSRGTLYKALDEKSNPTLETVLAVLRALNIELQASPVTERKEREHARA
ncbi:MAG TPA: addiction module antidote protein [Allosphingosinicella sp.]|jgi:probable addiction module antidote protein